jgi:hypothetical protein
MSSNKIESEAFKKKLVDTLKESKMPQTLQSVMRLKLIEKLGHDPNAKSLVGPKLDQVSLADRVALSLIRSYLAKKNLLMAVTVLDSQVGEHNAPMDDGQVSEILCQNRAGLIEVLKRSGNFEERNPLLYSLVDGLMANKFEKYDSATQTVSNYNDYDIDHKLQMIEEFHLGGMREEGKSNKQAFEERLRELDQRYKKEKELEMRRIREVEMLQVRASESKNWREKYQADKDELERLYNTQFNNLRDLERKALEQYTGKVKELEAQMVAKNAEISRVSGFVDKEADLKRMELGVQKRDLEKQKEEMRELEKDLKKRVDEVQMKELTFEQRLKNEVDTYKAVTLKDISEKKHLVDLKLNKLNEELNNLAEMRRRMEQLADRNAKIESELTEERKVTGS